MKGVRVTGRPSIFHRAGSAVCRFLGDELAEAAVAFRIVQEGDVAIIENAEEFVPAYAVEAVVAIAARLVVIDAKQSAVTATLFSVAATTAGCPPRFSTQRRISSWLVVVLALDISLSFAGDGYA
jgi:hypothetical protein